MTDWAPGDLAIAIGNDPQCTICKDNPVDPQGPKDGTTLCVSTVLHILSLGGCGLHFTTLEGFWCSCGFRKVRPDDQSGERADWELLLDSMKPKVDA